MKQPYWRPTMKRILLLSVCVSAFGCGGGESKVADKPTDEQIKAVERSDKSVEEEERGTPVKKKK